MILFVLLKVQALYVVAAYRSSSTQGGAERARPGDCVTDGGVSKGDL